MTRDKFALTSLLAAALGTLLLAGPAHASQSQRDEILTQLQMSDGSPINGPAWYGVNARTTSNAVAADGIKALNKVSNGFVRTFPPDFNWTDGGHAVQ